MSAPISYGFINNTDFDYSRAYCPKTSDSSFQRRSNFINFLKIIDGNKDWTLTKTLNQLSGDISGDVAIMGLSNSLQGANPNNPRILFKPEEDATIMASYNTGKEFHGYDGLEFILWNHKQKHFDFIEIAFSESKLNGKIHLDTPKVTVNPSKCTSCHTIGSKPNWDSYNFWSHQIPSVADEEVFSHEKLSIEKYAKRIRNSNSNGRWGFLKRFITEDDIDLADGIGFSNDINPINGCKIEDESFNKPKISNYLKLLVSYSVHCDSTSNSNNLSGSLSEYPSLNPNQILPFWAKKKHDDYFKKLFNTDEFVFPDTIRRELRRLDNDGLERRRLEFIDLLAELGTSLTSDIDGFINGRSNFVEKDPVEGSTDYVLFQVANLWYLLAPLGVNIDRWSPSIVPEEKSFGDFFTIGTSLALNEFKSEKGVCKKIADKMVSLVGSLNSKKPNNSLESTRDIIFAYDVKNHTQLDFMVLPKANLFMDEMRDNLKINKIIKKLRSQVSLTDQEYNKVLDLFLDWRQMSLSEAISKKAL